MGRQAQVVGTGFEGRAAVIRKYCADGKVVLLKREPRNKHDPNAIAVFVEVPRLGGVLGNDLQQIGYIRSSVAKSLAPKMDSGLNVSAVIRSFYAPSGKDHPRVSLELSY